MNMTAWSALLFHSIANVMKLHLLATAVPTILAIGEIGHQLW